MNKLAKGAIAGAAGLVLLLGGAGTFAYWNSTADIAGGTITAGNLLVENTGGAGVWTDQNGTTINIATYRIVPGDTLTYTDTLTVTAVGNNLVAELALGPESIAPADGGVPADVALAGFLEDGAVLTATGTGISGASPTYTVTAGTAGVSSVVTVAVTLAFPNANTAGAENTAKLGAVDLSDMTLTLTQTAPAVTP
ncbi:alternate-type signal peptide domain-containing protein [Herbiconiux moechotypicola]|uniref:Alternate-type signal peptide domain-containing protein n=1 Tax=Herbiconiux moechotypicola TaxID=637393 RepID=A0ABP5QM80_9MICO|nr:alternate-type signal peptide domain-containing protein [Herbiconiux moechotypicola]MCS5730385.1 alternate-type signal peptide domain-containing protein [Herbiconiux moechotypicola]